MSIDVSGWWSESSIQHIGTAGVRVSVQLCCLHLPAIYCTSSDISTLLLMDGYELHLCVLQLIVACPVWLLLPVQEKLTSCPSIDEGHYHVSSTGECCQHTDIWALPWLIMLYGSPKRSEHVHVQQTPSALLVFPRCDVPLQHTKQL